MFFSSSYPAYILLMSITAPSIAHPDFVPGTVWLAGAGPGDPSLLTLAALHGLQTADVILHDALVAPEILALAPVNTRLIPIGKRAGGGQTPQLAINAELIALAQQNLRVLRLKGGDPFIFGRGGEECLALRAAGIPYDIVPGITSGSAAATYAGVPLTYRSVSQSVLFVTGHSASPEKPINWSALAQGADTLVIYMGVERLQTICAALIDAGKAATTPTLAVEWATITQKEVHATLQNLPSACTRSHLRSPAIIIVGTVVSLHETLAFCPQLPLPTPHQAVS
jgi:uroporphyrin-III C-methyltransferase